MALTQSLRRAVFPWCGYSINMQDLSVTVDYTRYHTTCEACLAPWHTYSDYLFVDLQDSLTVEFGRRPGAVFAHKMMQYAPLLV